MKTVFRVLSSSWQGPKSGESLRTSISRALHSADREGEARVSFAIEGHNGMLISCEDGSK